MPPVPYIAPKTTGKVPTDLLDFDPNNPRLEGGIKNPTESQIIVALAETADLSEVVESIAANGYIDIEPIIAQRIADRWRVLEGNRRLAAIRILQQPSLAKGTGISVPEISKGTLKTLKEVTVYASRAQIRRAILSGSSTSMGRTNGTRSRRPGSPPTGTNGRTRKA